MSENILEGQARLEAYVERTLYENNVRQKDSVNGMMRSQKAGCSYEDRTDVYKRQE